MSPRFCCLLLLLCLPLLAFGQEERVVIRGVVVEADSSQPLPSVHLRVLNTKLGGVTSETGRFNTRVHPWDTIVFSSVGYEPYLLVPADRAVEQLTTLVIRMKPQTTMLQEVRVREYGDITKYIRRDYDSTVDMRRPRGEPMFAKKPRVEQKAVRVGVGPNGATLDGAVTAFANLFSSEFQQKKKVKELVAQQEAQAQREEVRAAMTQRYQTLARSVTELTASELQQLTDTQMPPPHIMRTMSDYQVITSIIQGLRTLDAQDEFLNDLLKTGTFEGQERNQ